MKRRLIACFIIISIIVMGGCQASSDRFYSFEVMAANKVVPFDNHLSENDFFANNLVIIPENSKQTEDSELTAKASLLVNNTDKKVIYSDHVYEKLYPASLTKLLTALVVFKYGELTDTVTFSYQASHISEPGAKRCDFAEGDQMSLETLLYSMLVYSGNDAAIAIAEHMGGSEEAFVKKMNEEAAKIGAVHSNFVNSHGLHDDNQYSTAYDLYLIFQELIKYDTFRSIIHTSSYTASYFDKNGNPKEKIFSTTNRFLNDEIRSMEGIDIVGGKTGTTNKAGYCLILLSNDKKGTDYISLILKASDSDQLYSQMSHLLSLVTKD
jgi:serine-type D-Ala-D-Ala carboxypeptidase (penicillin-binding protein 5/6)